MAIRTVRSTNCFRGPTDLKTSELWPENDAYASVTVSAKLASLKRRKAVLQPGIPVSQSIISIRVIRGRFNAWKITEADRVRSKPSILDFMDLSHRQRDCPAIGAAFRAYRGHHFAHSRRPAKILAPQGDDRCDASTESPNCWLLGKVLTSWPP